MTNSRIIKRTETVFVLFGDFQTCKSWLDKGMHSLNCILQFNDSY